MRQAGFIERAPHQRYRRIDVEGFDQVLEGALLKGGNSAVEVGIRCHDNDRQGRTTLFYPLQQFQAARSAEHTSELQSLMRTSYAVFCLKKKKHTAYLTYHLARQY